MAARPLSQLADDLGTLLKKAEKLPGQRSSSVFSSEVLGGQVILAVVGN